MERRSIETVIKGLECCTSGRGYNCCIGCPYGFIEDSGEECSGELMKDALGYLKEAKRGTDEAPRERMNRSARERFSKEFWGTEKEPTNKSHEEIMRELMAGKIDPQDMERLWKNGAGG